MTKDKQTPNLSEKMNRRARRALQRKHKPQHRDPNKVYEDETKIVYTDDSFKDKSKRVFTEGMRQAKERIKAMQEKYKLPTFITSHREPGYTKCIIINTDGRKRDFMPDIPPTRKILVSRHVAQLMVSGVCMLTRPTTNYDEKGQWLDGSWAITPAEYRMMNVTTIQHVRRRSFALLRRFPYEISFDGRVWPAHLLHDYEIDPTQKRTVMYLTKEHVEVKNKQGVINTFFRFWKNKP